MTLPKNGSLKWKGGIFLTLFRRGMLNSKHQLVMFIIFWLISAQSSPSLQYFTLFSHKLPTQIIAIIAFTALVLVHNGNRLLGCSTRAIVATAVVVVMFISLQIQSFVFGHYFLLLLPGERSAIAMPERPDQQAEEQNKHFMNEHTLPTLRLKILKESYAYLYISIFIKKNQKIK